MTDFNYQALARKTNSPNFFLDQIPPGVLARALEDTITTANILDRIKKVVYYGKGSNLQDAPSTSNVELRAVPADFFHTIIGIVTEAGELAEALYKAMFLGEEFDVVNFREELGDIAWYRALGLGAAGSTPDENDRENIAKLMKRFRDKFTDEEANNRDLAAERIVLEGYTGLLKRASVVNWGPGHTRINGLIYGDKQGRFLDGYDVTTNKVTGVDVAPNGQIVIETASGSRYLIEGPIEGWTRTQLGDDLAQEVKLDFHVPEDRRIGIVTDDDEITELVLDKGPFRDPSGQDWLATSGGQLYRLTNYSPAEPDNGISRV